MSKSYPIVERHANGVVVVARTVVEAQQAAGDALGGDCTITSVEKVRDGGLGGFFATELMRVTATPSRFRTVDRELSANMSSAEDLLTSMREQSPQFVDRLINELRQSTEPHTAASIVAASNPAPALVAAPALAPVAPPAFLASEPAVPDTVVARLQAAQGEPVAQPQAVQPQAYVAQPRVVQPYSPTPPNAAPVQQHQHQQQVASAPSPFVHESYQSYGNQPGTASSNPVQQIQQMHPIVSRAMTPVVERLDSRWSHQSLRALGLPDRIVDAALQQRPTSEAEWIVALMGAFGKLCVTPPHGPTILMGPACANLARQLKLVSVGTEELAESISSVAVPHITAKIARFARNDRFVHLMVGGNWHHLSGIDAQVVSAATSGDLLEAIRVCTAWNAVLGWCWSGSQYERLDQFTVVSHIRAILCGIEQPQPADERAMAYS